jgi:hypothetical protein
MNSPCSKVFEQEDSSSMLEPFSRYDVAILKNVWHLDVRELRLLDYKQTYLTTVSKFLQGVQEEKFPQTYQDSYKHGESKYFISYLFCSGQFLEELSEVVPTTPIAFQLRINKQNKLHICLVRQYDRSWTTKQLVEQGAIEL